MYELHLVFPADENLLHLSASTGNILFICNVKPDTQAIECKNFLQFSRLLPKL